MRIRHQRGASPGCSIRSATSSGGCTYSIPTGQTYVDWIRRFIVFHRKRHPKEMGAPEVEAFLTIWPSRARWPR